MYVRTYIYLIGITGDKGAVLREKMNELGIKQDQCIFADDKTGNLDSAKNDCDTLLIQERAGMDFTDIEYLEQRARLPRKRFYK